MGHREDLLDGAKRCLFEKGYARTTSRDIVAASGTNLASIGYHYGTKETLLRIALISAINDWWAVTLGALSSESDSTLQPLDRFEATWTRVIELFPTDRKLWTVNFEVFAQVAHDEELRKAIASTMPDAHEALAELFQGIETSTDRKSAQLVGRFYQALLTGVLAQWLIDPEHVPSGHDLTEALRIIAAMDVGPSVASSATPSTTYL